MVIRSKLRKIMQDIYTWNNELFCLEPHMNYEKWLQTSHQYTPLKIQKVVINKIRYSAVLRPVS